MSHAVSVYACHMAHCYSLGNQCSSHQSISISAYLLYAYQQHWS